MQDTEKWSKASLTIHSGTLSPEEIEAYLGVVATRKHRKDDIVSPKNPNNLRKRNFYCVTSVFPTSESMEKHIEFIINTFESKKAELQELLKTSEVGISCGFSCGNGQGGFVLSPELLSRIANVGLPLSLDLYPPSEIAE